MLHLFIGSESGEYGWSSRHATFQYVRFAKLSRSRKVLVRLWLPVPLTSFLVMVGLVLLQYTR
jgi:hypothetical protein